jgi:hypothetical protein
MNQELPRPSEVHFARNFGNLDRNVCVTGVFDRFSTEFVEAYLDHSVD